MDANNAEAPTGDPNQTDNNAANDAGKSNYLSIWKIDF